VSDKMEALARLQDDSTKLRASVWLDSNKDDVLLVVNSSGIDEGAALLDVARGTMRGWLSKRDIHVYRTERKESHRRSLVDLRDPNYQRGRADAFKEIALELMKPEGVIQIGVGRDNGHSQEV
jgi:hypothetical protein